ncbi:M20/M25/M40 family metallo-hydrolase [Actinoplanes sp. NBRC 103695]|uniref:M20 family metallopeptidase n=1 Tax=Actinoplanes sp. NBRC 103695 TaxID=3032202 RepID=UPI00249FA040|nr:M20/M25/M40 family metallo-hydrolase [Actinoplanes sp. NBRC 103695]GLY92985.1 peptidase M20 [Actinoplanes sp. NBRC 103695]
MELDALLDRAAGLIAIPSTADRPDDLARALDLVLDSVGPGFAVRRFTSRGKPSALVSTTPGRNDFRVILNGHLDVVPGSPDQFVARREGDRLYGRGAQDMKVAALVLAEVFRELAPVLPYPLGLQLVCDEEVGGFDGTAHQIERGVTAGFVVIGEQSGLRVVAESKGLLQVRLVATGRAAHAAYPWLGDNALIKVTRAVEEILRHYPVPAAEEWVTTVNVARIVTGNAAVNQVPADATAWLDVRFPPEDGRSGAEIAAHLDGLAGDGVEVIVDSVAPPHHADPQCAEVKLLQRSDPPDAEAHGGGSRRGDLLRKHGAADGRFYSARGVNAVIFGPGGDGQHGPAEYLDVTTVEPYYAAVSGFLRAIEASGAG